MLVSIKTVPSQVQFPSLWETTRRCYHKSMLKMVSSFMKTEYLTKEQLFIVFFCFLTMGPLRVNACSLLTLRAVLLLFDFNKAVNYLFSTPSKYMELVGI